MPTSKMKGLFLGVLLLLGLRAEVNALSFEYKPVTFDEDSTHRPTMHLVLSGIIEVGDTARFKEFIRRKPQEFLIYAQLVALDSPGGDVAEAMELAALFRQLLVQVRVFSPMRCASACFLLWVGSPIHGANGPPSMRSLAVHRPYFSPRTTAQLSAAAADKAHSAAFAKARKWLQDQLVPQAIIDKMFALPSNDAYWLTEADIDALGTYAPWYAEWLLARCPDVVAAETAFVHQHTAEASARFNRAIDCAVAASVPERQRVFRQLKFM